MRNIKLSIDTKTFVRFWLVILGFVALIGAVWLARGAVITVLVAFFLALVLNRPVSFLARHLPGKSRVMATFIAYLLVVAVVVLVFFNVVPIFVEQVSNFLKTLPNILNDIQNRSSWFGDFLVQYNLEGSWNNWLKELQNEIGVIASGIGGSFVYILNDLLGAIINVFFAAVLTFFMLIEGPSWEEKFWRLAYTDKKRRDHHQTIAKKMYGVISNYVSGQMTVAAISATLTAICVIILSQFFTAIQIPLILTAWLVIFVMLFIPIFGAFIGGGIVTLLLALYAWPAALIYLAFFIIEQQIMNNITAPKIQSRKTDTSALVIIVAIVLGMQIAGILGVLVAIPIAGCITVVVRDLLRQRRIKRAAAEGEIIDPNNEQPNVVVVFETEKREFVKPKILKKKSESPQD